MIPFRCYKDLWSLRSDVKWLKGTAKIRIEHIDAIIKSIDEIISRWEEADDKELEGMKEEYERSEKDCMWEGRE